MSKGTPIVNQNCPFCQAPLNAYWQEPLHPRSTRPSYWISTCENAACDFHQVTLEDAAWTLMISDEVMQAKYRQAVIDNSASTKELIARHGGAK